MLLSRHSNGSRFGLHVILPIDYPNNKSLKHKNMEKDKDSNHQKVGEQVQSEGLKAENDSSISSASHCRTVKIMSL